MEGESNHQVHRTTEFARLEPSSTQKPDREGLQSKTEQCWPVPVAGRSRVVAGLLRKKHQRVRFISSYILSRNGSHPAWHANMNMSYLGQREWTRCYESGPPLPSTFVQFKTVLFSCGKTTSMRAAVVVPRMAVQLQSSKHRRKMTESIAKTAVFRVASQKKCSARRNCKFESRSTGQCVGVSLSLL